MWCEQFRKSLMILKNKNPSALIVSGIILTTSLVYGQILKWIHHVVIWLCNAITEGLYKKRLLLRCKHRFKSDLMNNINHMRISGTEPSSAILTQKSIEKFIRDVPNVPKQAGAKRDGVINPQYYNFKQF